MTWDDSPIGSVYTLSNGNKTATAGGGTANALVLMYGPLLFQQTQRMLGLLILQTLIMLVVGISLILKQIVELTQMKEVVILLV